MFCQIYHYRDFFTSISILHDLRKWCLKNIIPFKCDLLQIKIMLDFCINYFLPFIALHFMLLFKFVCLWLKHVFHCLNVANKGKIH